MMRTDTEDQKSICKPSSINECPHFDHVQLDSPNLKKSEDFIYVGVQVPPQYVFHIQRIADEHFPKENTDNPHRGNRAEAVLELLKYGIDRYNHVKKRGTFREMMAGKYSESVATDEDLRQEVEALRERNQRLENSLSEKRKELRELKKDYDIVRDNSDILIHIVDLLKVRPRSLDELVTGLREKKGLEFRKYEHPLDSSKDIGLKGLTDYLLQNLIERQSVEVTRSDGRTVYESKGQV